MRARASGASGEGHEEARVPRAHKAEVEKLLTILDAALAGRTWLVGQTFSLVDVHLAGAIGWSSSLGFDMKSFASIEAWMTKCKARPGYAVAMGG